MPEEFNVHLFERATESGVVYGSKAVGEPPLMLAFSVREALRQAVGAFGPAGHSGRPGQPGHARRPSTGRSRRPGRPAPSRTRHARPTESLARGLSMDWLSALAAAARGRVRPGVLVTVVEVRGHAPRDAGAKMVVGTDQHLGQRRRRQPGGDRRTPGPGADHRRRRPTRRRWSPGSTSTPATIMVGSAAAARSGCCWSRCPVRPTVAIFGVGHVGYELARILSRLEVRLHLVDSRAEQLDAAPAGRRHRRGGRRRPCTGRVLGELVLERLPAGAHVLIMTHDHAEDFALCDAALRARPRRSAGEHRADRVQREVDAVPAQPGRRRAMTEAAIARITSPDRAARDRRQGAGRDRRRRSRPHLRPAAGALSLSRAAPVRRPARHASTPLHDALPRPPSSTSPATRSPTSPTALWPPSPTARSAGPRRGDHRPRRRSPSCAAAHRDEEVVDLRRRGAAARACRHPRALPAGPGDRRAGHAAAGLAGAVRAARGGPARRGRVRRGRGRGVPRRAGRARAPPRRWSSAPTSPPRWTSSSRRAERSGLRITAGQVVSDRILRDPTC